MRINLIMHINKSQIILNVNMALLYLCIFKQIMIYLNYYLTNRLSLEIKLYIKDIFQKKKKPFVLQETYIK
ncbi:hypothetical protein DWW79_04700 [Alistipes sp. AF17-16]|nr:hypothetical protein DWW79_04700 [Alistipes sp. AF17-16]